jgi:putative endonuclease
MTRDRHYFVYIIASISRVLYIGMTGNLRKRVWEHKNGIFEGFSKQYRCHRLVWFQSYDDVANAIDREKQLKRWNRAKKEWLIAQKNSTWEDFAAEWYVQQEPKRQTFGSSS